MFSSEGQEMTHPRLNRQTARTAVGFVMMVLIMSVFTLIVGCNAGVVTSSGEGARSEPATNDPELPGIADVAFIDGSHAWAVNQSGTVLYQVEEGTSSRKQETDFGSRPLISVLEHKTGFVFAQKKLWRTTDAGQSWQKVSDFDPPDPDLGLTSLNMLQFVDEQHGWLVDVFGVWRTEDGGVRWQRVFTTSSSKEVDELRQVSFRGSEQAVVAARQGVYLTVDGGRNWKVTNRSNDFFAVYALDERTSWAWGAWLERTDDGGNTWRKLYELNGRIDIFSTNFINKNEGWAAGLEVPESLASRVRNPDAPKSTGILLHTKDGGKNWDRAATPADTAFRRIAFSDSKHGWLLGKNRLYRTLDGGVTWTTVLDVPSRG